MKIKTLCFILVLLVTGSMSTIDASANDQKVKELHIGESFAGVEGTTVIQNLKMIKYISITNREVTYATLQNRHLKSRMH